LAGLPLAFDELHHRDRQIAAERAEGDAERGGGLALAVARVDGVQGLGVGHADSHFCACATAASMVSRSLERTSRAPSRRAAACATGPIASAGTPTSAQTTSEP